MARDPDKEETIEHLLIECPQFEEARLNLELPNDQVSNNEKHNKQNKRR